MNTFEVGQKVTRNVYYLMEAFPNVKTWRHSVYNTWIKGTVTRIEGKDVFVQWPGYEWEKAGPMRYRANELDHAGVNVKPLDGGDTLVNPRFDLEDLYGPDYQENIFYPEVVFKEAA